MTKKPEWITQKEAAESKGMTLAALNQLVRRGVVRSETIYGKRLVSKEDVEAFQPMKRKARATKKATKKGKSTK